MQVLLCELDVGMFFVKLYNTSGRKYYTCQQKVRRNRNRKKHTVFQQNYLLTRKIAFTIYTFTLRTANQQLLQLGISASGDILVLVVILDFIYRTGNTQIFILKKGSSFVPFLMKESENIYLLCWWMWMRATCKQSKKKLLVQFTFKEVRVERGTYQPQNQRKYQQWNFKFQGVRQFFLQYAIRMHTLYLLSR